MTSQRSGAGDRTAPGGPRRQPPAGRLGCREVRRTLQAFLDGVLAPDHAVSVASHLESCSRCRVESETLARVTADLRRLRPDLDLAAYTRLIETVERLNGTDRP